MCPCYKCKEISPKGFRLVLLGRVNRVIDVVHDVTCCGGFHPLLILLVRATAFLLNMLVTFVRSRSNEPLWVWLPLPSGPAICEGSTISGSSAYGPVRIFDWSEPSSDFGKGRSDVFVGLGRRGVMVPVDC